MGEGRSSVAVVENHVFGQGQSLGKKRKEACMLANTPTSRQADKQTSRQADKQSRDKAGKRYTHKPSRNEGISPVKL